MVFTEHLIAKAVCKVSIIVLGWQPGAPKTPVHGFQTKRRDFLKLVFCNPLEFIAKAVCKVSIIVLGWQPGAPKTPVHGFQTKRRDFLKLIGPVTARCVL